MSERVYYEEDLYHCKLCHAVITRRSRGPHNAWHARVNARVLTTNQIKQLMDLLAERGITDAPVVALDDETAGL